MARRNTDSLIFDSIRLEGNLFVPAVLEKLAKGEHPTQTAETYHIPRGLKLVDEYSRSFRIALALWKAFQEVMARTDIDAWRATQGFINELFRDSLGYATIHTLGDVIEIKERGYPVTMMACDHIPVIVTPHDVDLDTPLEIFSIIGSGTRKRSAHQIAQQFLDASDPCTWAFVTNGKVIRLIRDTETLTRPTFLEFDLATILTEERYADFASLWRLFHVSRGGTEDANCIWESWKSEGEAQGIRVRDGLRNGVTEALIALGEGFLQQRENESLRTDLLEGKLSVDDYFQQLLRLIYRFLFLFTIEERGLLHVEDDSDAAITARKAYMEGYSMRRLKDRALKRIHLDAFTDLWVGIRVVFKALQLGESRLALPPLGGLFASKQCEYLDCAILSNRSLLTAIRHLRWSVIDGKTSVVDYRNMGPEELGSVYESLLELVPTVNLETRSFGFIGITEEGSTDGNARKTSGSYYTDDSLVQELLDSALNPVIDKRIQEHASNPEQALLSMTVIDPACGSGHFLLGAARRLAEKLADVRSVDGAVKPEDYRHALRDVIAHCIHGVDRNPMAVELARTALWLEGFEAGRPLSFLDHHLVCGDALLGITDFKQIEKGIPDAAFKALTGDDKETCKELTRLNKIARKELEKLKKGDDLFAGGSYQNIFDELDALEAMPDETTDEVAAKERAYAEFLEHAKSSSIAKAADLSIAAYLAQKADPLLIPSIPTTHTLNAVLFPSVQDPQLDQKLSTTKTLCENSRVLHWPIAFAQVFAKGGFDCVLGNPPWERIKLQEEEFFATRGPDIANAKNKAARGKMIEALNLGSEAERALYFQFQNAKRESEAVSLFAHLKGKDGGRYPFTGVGDVNTYALFSEANSQLVSNSGRAGFIVQGGIATDDSTKRFFSNLINTSGLISLLGFDNQLKIFPDVHSDTPFVLMTIGKNEGEVRLCHYILRIEELKDQRRFFSLSAEDFQLINPNTLTCPVFRSNADAELTKKIYRNVPVLIREEREDSPEENPWGISFQAMMHMSNDSRLFLDEDDRLPLYEAKMMHQFDHRWATYGWNEQKQKLEASDVSLIQKQNAQYEPTPRYWVEERHVIARIADAPASVRKAYAAQDEDAMLIAVANWIEAGVVEDLLSGMRNDSARDRVISAGGERFRELPTKDSDWMNNRAINEAQNSNPLTDSEIDLMKSNRPLDSVIYDILDKRSPRWLMGWRDVTNATNQRTVIASVVPMLGVGHKMPLFKFRSIKDQRLVSVFYTNFSSIILDYVARQKIGGTSLTYHLLKQLPILTPESYSSEHLNYIVPRVLELTYTSESLRSWAEDLEYFGDPFPFDPDRRAKLRAELDAYYAKLYGLTRDELRYILDPSETHGDDYPTETFRGLKNNDIRNYGYYRTQTLVLQAWDEQQKDPV